jgi:hypothetical protein
VGRMVPLISNSKYKEKQKLKKENIE